MALYKCIFQFCETRHRRATAESCRQRNHVNSYCHHITLKLAKIPDGPLIGWLVKCKESSTVRGNDGEQKYVSTNLYINPKKNHSHERSRREEILNVFAY